MQTTSFRRALVPILAVLALTLAACGGGSGASGGTGSGGLSGTLRGGGASTQALAQNAWAVGFNSRHPDVTVQYDPVGSGAGRENFISGGYPFAGSDTYLTNEQGELAAAKERCNNTHPIEIPVYISPIALAYNLPGVENLKLTPKAVAGIFAGKITQWDAPAIARTNPGVDLPDARITPVHRSDESGTTGNFTSYLTAVAPDVWTYGVVETWPTQAGGEGADGTAGVIQAITEGKYTIGYADASQVTDQLGVAKVKVGNGFVGPSPEAAAKILEASPQVQGRPPVDLAFDLDYTTQQSGTYPIVLTSYLMACQEYDDKHTAKLVEAYLSYVVSDAGQQLAAEQAGSAPLSDSLQQKAQAAIDEIADDYDYSYAAQ